ncbi:hypothetical protein [Flavobacterium sp. 9R]|uniref:hypothetical protein n=1 Tax=Flavobacterium sp. 9R TaxID=2653143 RepID=UPI0013574396|nr:hypothetical protein [Flavobacterium sp. 9R]
MDFFEIIFGRGILELVGGFIRFFLNKCYSLLTGKPHKSLSFYFKETKDETFSNGAGNHVVGTLFVFALALILVIIMSTSWRKYFY